MNHDPWRACACARACAFVTGAGRPRLDCVVHDFMHAFGHAFHGRMHVNGVHAIHDRLRGAEKLYRKLKELHLHASMQHVCMRWRVHACDVACWRPCGCA